MKRCSKCDFIYEDDQSLCDMDGGELVHESALFPPAIGNATISGDLPVRPPWRSFALTAAATVVLGAVLSLGFYGFTNRPSQQSSSAPNTATSESVSEPVIGEPAMAATPAHSDSPASPDPIAKEKTAASSAAKPSPSRQGSPGSREPKKPPPAKPKHEEGSKVGSLLKKTGRILKKPFKF